MHWKRKAALTLTHAAALERMADIWDGQRGADGVREIAGGYVAEVGAMLRTLPADAQKVLRLMYHDGADVGSIAKLCGISRIKVYSVAAVGLRKIADMLDAAEREKKKVKA